MTTTESYKQSNDGIEMLGENYENLKSFFTYRDIDNIYKFFESDIHINAEKKFYKMVSLDITKCFPSIYTHSIAWAINSKEHAKRNIGSSSQSFPSIFDSLIQKSNYNETNGILVGPEISRIFAELILQDIDDKIIKKLEEKGLSYSDEYVFYRYVDDIFLFYNNDIDKNIFIEQLESELEQYKLHLNSSKIKYFSRPLITPISVAKNKISKILNECFSVSSPNDGEKLRVKLTYKSAVRDFKTLMYESEVDFVDITSYSISIIENKSKEIYKSYIKNKLSFDCIFLPLESIINFSFYLFSSHPTVNTAIKLCRVIKSLLSFLQEINYPKELVYKLKCSVYDNSVMVLENHKGSSLFIEKSYLLVLLKQLGKSFWLDEKDLLKFVVPKDRSRSHTLVGFDYFCFISLIFYMENKVRYKELRELVIDELSKRFNDLDTYQLASSEVIHLVIDLCSCPYLEEEDKVRIFSASSIDLKFIRSVKNSGIYFTSWVNFDLIKELDAKRSYAVY
ncbi:antiviral reverse transcriptase Drt3b [Pseudoalteromonas tetraodonis]|uniref:antiviral reverse transcriptase Drt3b n=2 Tax=Pseudoalteromonas tetraodonis TaxID=43659 RepID=UPI003CFD4E31